MEKASDFADTVCKKERILLESKLPECPMEVAVFSATCLCCDETANGVNADPECQTVREKSPEKNILLLKEGYSLWQRQGTNAGLMDNLRVLRHVRNFHLRLLLSV